MESSEKQNAGFYEWNRYFGDLQRYYIYTFVILLFLLFFLTKNPFLPSLQETQISKKVSPRYAWVIIVSGDAYAKGAMVLAHSLRKVKTKYELVCLSAEKENNRTKQKFDLLRKFFDRIVFLEPASPDWFNKTEQFAINSLSIYFTKIRVLELIEYDKIGVIGCDYLVIKNIDRIFGCPAPCGVFDSILWETNSRSPVINGDLLVLKPSISDVKGLIEILYRINWINMTEFSLYFFYDELRSFLGPQDQGIFAYYYGTRWTVFSYSLGGIEVRIVCSLRPYACDISKISSLHFAAMNPRPWEVMNATVSFAFESAIYRESYQIYSEFMIDLMEGLSIEDRLVFDHLSKVHTGLTCPSFMKCSKKNGENYILESTPYDILAMKNVWKLYCDKIPKLPGQFFRKKRINLCEAKM